MGKPPFISVQIHKDEWKNYDKFVHTLGEYVLALTYRTVLQYTSRNIHMTACDGQNRMKESEREWKRMEEKSR